MLDKISVKILKQLNSNEFLNTYQIEVLIKVWGIESLMPRMQTLYDKNFIDTYNEPSFEFDSYSFETNFKLSIDGKAYLEKISDERKQFRINSIYVPFLVALGTTLLANYLTK